LRRLVAPAGFKAFAGFRFQVRVGPRHKVECGNGEADIDIAKRRRAEALGILHEHAAAGVEFPACAKPRGEARFADVGRFAIGVVVAVDGIGVGIEPVALPTQRRDQRQALAKAHFVLPEHAQFLAGGLGEIANRQHFADHRFRGDAGVEVGLEAIAQVAIAGMRELDADHVPVIDAKPLAALLAEQLEAACIFVVIEVAHAQREKARAPFRAAVLFGMLAGVRVLAVYEQIERIQPRQVGVDAAIDADPGAAAAIVGAQRGGAGKLAGAIDQRLHIGFDIAAAVVHGQAPATERTRVADQFEQRALAQGIGGVGLAQRIIGRVLAFAAFAPRQRQHRLPRPRFGGPAGAGQHAVVAPGIADTRTQVRPRAIAAREEIGGLTGAVTDDAGECVAAPKGRGRATQYLDLLDRLDVDQIAPGKRKAANAEAFRQRHVVHHHADAVAIEAAYRKPLQAEAAGFGDHADAGLVTHHVADVLSQRALEFAAIDDTDRADHLLDRLGDLACHDHHAIEFNGRPCRHAAGIAGAGDGW